MHLKDFPPAFKQARKPFFSLPRDLPARVKV
jgi:hypothetical protein